MTNFKELDSLVEASDNEALPPTELLALQQKLAAHRYRLAEQVSVLKRKADTAEVDRKSLFAKAKLTCKADTIGSKPLGEQAAADKAEQLPEVIRARADEIMMQAEFEAAKMKMQASGDVLSSLMMRISFARDERKQSAHIQAP